MTSTPITASAAGAALTKLAQANLISGIDLERLRAIAAALAPETQKCSLADMWQTLFPGLVGENAEAALRKLKQRLSELQKEAIAAGKMPANETPLALGVTRKSGLAPRFLWFTGPAGSTALARTPDIAGVLPGALQETPALPPELSGQAEPGREPLLLLTINEHETAAVRAVFAPEQPPRHFLRDQRSYELLGYTADRRPIIAYRCRMGSLNAGAALMATVHAIQDHLPAAVLGVGIAFGNKSLKQQLGDVLVSSEVRNYESGRDNANRSFTPRGHQIPAAGPWTLRATQLKPEGFAVHLGLMLSGEKLLDNEKAVKKLFSQFPTAIGGDMEGAGLMSACHEGNVNWLVIKGISDWADGSKSTISDEQKTRDQQTAAAHAAAIAYAAIHLAWPRSDQADSPAGSPVAESAQLQIEAKTPDFRELQILIENQGCPQGGIDPRYSQAQPEDVADKSLLNAHASLLAWLEETGAPPIFALLGEYGMGKTICCQRLYLDLRQRRAEPNAPAWVREPLYFDLRALSLFKKEERAKTLAMPTQEELINDLIKHGWSPDPALAMPSFPDIQAQLRQGALLILDGLDECLVHLVESQHSAFIRSLLELISDADPEGQAGTRLLISCRSNFFKTLGDQISFFTGRHRGQIDAAWYRSLVLQPFSEAQIQRYLQQVVPDVPIERLMELIRNTHNLSELAERPMTLKLIASQIQELEVLRLRGEPINSARLYDLVAQSWLERDEGKHHLRPEHKLRLMPDLAAHLWQSGRRSLPFDELHRWFHLWRQNQPDLKERYGPTVYNQEKLEEDLRTATFVVRQDAAAQHREGFRFAHSSLLEFFLARHLFQAVLEDRPERWALPMPSAETLRFLAELLIIEEQSPGPHQKSGRLAATLNRWRKSYRAEASENLLRYALNAPENAPRPLLAGFDLSGATLRGWEFNGTAGAWLPMQACLFAGADLRQTRWQHVRLDDAGLAGARLDQAAFQHCRLQNSVWDAARLTGTVFRHCNLQGSRLDNAHAYRAQRVACTGAPAMDAATWLSPPPTPRHPMPWQPTPPAAHPQRLQWLTGHNSPVTAVAFSPDATNGLRLASASADNTLRLWDAHSGETLLSLSGHQDSVYAVAFSPDGQRLASASADNTLRLWDAHSGETLLSLSGHQDSVSAVAFSPDGQRIASASADNTLRLWDAHSGECLLTFSGHQDSVYAVAFSPDGQRLASASRDKTLRLWDAHSGECLLTFSGHQDSVSAVAFSPDGQRIASASHDKTLRLWDAHSGECLLTFSGHQDWVLAVAFSPDGQRLASASADHTLRLWDAHSGECLLSLSGHQSWGTAVAFSPDATNGLRLASASYDHTLRLWDAHSGETLLTLSGHQDSVFAVAFSPDGQRIASASADNTLRLWDAHSGESLLTFSGHQNPVLAVAFSPDGQRLASASHDHTLRLWDAHSGECLLTFSGHQDSVSAVAFSPDGQRIASASHDKTLRLWDAHSGECLLTFSGHQDWVLAVAFSPDGQRLASASADNTLRLWDAHSGESLLTFSGHQDSVTAVAFSPDGQRIASASYDHTLRLWDAHSGECLLTFSGHQNGVLAVAFSPDGQRLASASADHTLRLWDAHSGECLLTFSGHQDSVFAVAFSPDGQRLASASADNTLRLWDAHSGAWLRGHWAQAAGATPGHAVWLPPQADPDYPAGRLISASGEAWRLLGWQVWDHPSAPGQTTRLPLDAYPTLDASPT